METSFERIFLTVRKCLEPVKELGPPRPERHGPAAGRSRRRMRGELVRHAGRPAAARSIVILPICASFAISQREIAEMLQG